MPRSIQEGRLRLPIVRLTLKMIRLVSKTYFENDMGGANAEELVLCCAVFIGQAESRLMNASKLADYAGIPRSTVIRKLRGLIQRGLIEVDDRGRYRLPLGVINSDEAIATAHEIRRSMFAAASAVSKMDSEAIAKRKIRE